MNDWTFVFALVVIALSVSYFIAHLVIYVDVIG
jgi:hypothetical protein